MQIGTSGTWGEDFVGEEVESQGHARPKLHLEAWQRHQSWPLGLSGFSSYV